MISARAILLTAAAALSLSACKSSDKPAEKPAAATTQPAPATAPAPQKPLTYEENFSASVTAKVKSVDLSNRLITLQDSKGNQETFRVDPAVKRLAEVRPGDNVTARYQAHLLAELRAPTPDEARNPIAYVDVSGRAPRTEDPAAAAAEAVRIVTTVESVDVPNMLVTLRGPLGDLAVVKGKNPDNLKRIKRGDTIVITFAHAMAVALDKASGS
jgi:hypothetical protein